MINHKSMEIIHEKENNRIIIKNNLKCGEINYELKEGTIIDIYRTFVDPDHRGKGIAKKLMMQVIDFAEKKNYKIIPSCSFAVSFFKINKKYQYLLASGINLDNPGSCRLPHSLKN